MPAIFIAVAIFLLILLFSKTPVTVKSHWQHFYDNCQFSAQDFYEQVEDELRERKITDVTIEEESFKQSHAFSGKRVYLKITEEEHVFYVGAATFGRGMFVSWWLCVKDEGLLNKIPVLNMLLGKDRKNKTFYQMDTEGMYQSVIHSTVIAVAEGITESHGIRLSEFERQYNLAK